MPRLVGHGPRNKSLAVPGGRAEASAAGLTPRVLKSARWRRDIDHFADLCHLAAASADIVVPNVVEALLVFANDGFALAMNDSIWRHDARSAGSVSTIELDGAAVDEEQISFHWAVCLEEVWLEVHVEEFPETPSIV